MRADTGPNTTTRPATAAVAGNRGQASRPSSVEPAGRKIRLGTAAKNRAVTSSRSPATSTVIPARGAVADDVLDQVFGPSQRAGPERRHPGPPAAQCEDEGRCASRVRRCPASGSSLPADALQHPHRPAEFVQPHDRTGPGVGDRCAEGTGGIQKVQMRFVVAVEELLHDEPQGSVGTAGDAPTTSPRWPCAPGSQPNSDDALFLGKVQQPQPDPAAAPVGGERHLPGKGRGDRTARCLAAGRRPRPPSPPPPAGPPPGTAGDVRGRRRPPPAGRGTRRRAGG